MNKILVSSELMKNQKAASVLSRQSHFECLQDSNGHAMFFSIGDKKAFNLIIEKPNSKTGWEVIDLSSELSHLHNNKHIKAQTFAVTQNFESGNITIALVVRAEGEASDTLYVLSALSNAADASWIKSSSARNWLARPYDDTKHPLKSVTISYVYLTPIHKESANTCLIAGVPSTTTTKYIQNYTVQLSGKTAWHTLQTAENFESIRGQVIGKAKASSSVGLYQLTSLNQGLTIDFIPMQSFFGPPTVIKMKAPEGATKIATVTVDDKNNTNLFIAAKDGLYLFTPDKQVNSGKAAKVIDNPIFANTKKLHAHQSADHTVIWGLNQKGDIFYSRCAKGQESTTTAWSHPIPILTGVTHVSSFLNQRSANNVVFAHTKGNEVIQLIQDPQTTIWHQRKILLPLLKINDMVEYTTYSTHVQLTGNDNLPLRETTISLTSTSQCSVYVDDDYYVLSPDAPIKIKTDMTGTATIVQETRSLGAVCYHLKLDDGTKIDVNPMTKLLDKISHVKNGDDLANVTVTNADGSTKKLIPNSTSKSDITHTAKALQNFKHIASQMPQDGSRKSVQQQQNTKALSAASTAFMVSPDTIWGLSFSEDGIKHHEGTAAMTHYGLQLNAAGTDMAVSSPTIQLNSTMDAIETTAGDMFNWLEYAFNEVKQFFVKVIDGVYHFVIELGGKLYRFVADCISDVAHAIEFVFKKIKVFIDDLIKWVGFLFQWNDIIRTHNVLKNLIKRHLEHAVSEIGTYKAQVKGAFGKVKSELDKWAGLDSPSLKRSLSQQTASTPRMKGQDDPQSHWGAYHLKHNLSSSKMNSATSPKTDHPQLEGLMKTLSGLIDKEKEAFETAFKRLDNKVLGDIQNLSLEEIIKRIIAIIGDLLLDSVENIIVLFIDIIEILAKGAVAILDMPIEIPVISKLYKDITGNNLSLLDVVCLVAAIPGTVIYKLAYGSTPYPDDAFTRGLIQAKTWQQIQAMFNPTAPVANSYQQDLSVAQSSYSLMDANEQNQTNERPKTLINERPKTLIIVLRLVATASSGLFIISSIYKRAAIQEIEGRPAQPARPAQQGRPARPAQPGIAPREIQASDYLISGLHGLLFFTTTYPSLAASIIASSDKLNNVHKIGTIVYGFTVVQKIVDMGTIFPEMKTWKIISGFVDCFFGVVGGILVIISLFEKHDVRAITAAGGNLCWNLNRIATPFAGNPKVFTGKMICIGLYGAAQGVLVVEELVIKD